MLRHCDKTARIPLVATLLLPLSFQGMRVQAFIIAASRNAIVSGILTGLVVLAIMTGTIGIGTAAAYLLNRTSGKKGLAIGVLVVMIICAAVIAFTQISTVYVSIKAWMDNA